MFENIKRIANAIIAGFKRILCSPLSEEDERDMRTW